MTNEPDCLRCQTCMVRGFVLDSAHSALLQARWCEGEPEKSWWGGEVKPNQAKGGLRIVAYRCPACGYLESYADEPAIDDQGTL